MTQDERRKYLIEYMLAERALRISGGVPETADGARRILTENRGKLDELANYLYEKETITGSEFMKILKGEETV